MDALMNNAKNQHASGIKNILQLGQSFPNHHPWPRALITSEIWHELIQGLANGAWTLLGLWGEPGVVHLAVYEEASGTLSVASLPCPDGRFPSVGRRHPPAQRLERSITDLVGLQTTDASDGRPWLDHGRWPLAYPLGTASIPPRSLAPYPFLPAEGESLHQIPVGPVHAGIIEPGHFRFTANGEAVVRLEERLGYVHKGIEALLNGMPLERAARLVSRVSGDSTVAYGLAFARAAEAATETVIPERAHWLRALMAELERLANHCGDIGAICNDAAFALMLAHCSVLRERVLRTSATCFGHRLLMDCIVPGGVSADLSPDGIQAMRELITEFRHRFPPLIDLYDNTASLQNRTVSTGFVRPALIKQFGCGGVIGRAGGRAFDARRQPGYPPYDQLDFESPVLTDSDVNARVWVRIREVEQSLTLIERIVQKLPTGPIKAEIQRPGEIREGMALVEGFRGDVLVWLRLNADGTVARCHPRDPSWFQWPLLEAAIENNIVADFPLCNKSFNCSYSGHDL
ncbi:NADH-ubiquinone oxidoreductase chain 49kDa [Candidatus Competibacter denitrificans Run_A_D11]|uniref:NADH-ubiquinone oxidoreductase chain 49kDa n=2 Tax=Candidatus Competibacter TaxID=221279 RepID=W6M536_9GAMM|nr:NADH-ubiquinone oxidoreductase chain 49kDa [Candidatus Competibacter denitrificans Run_A_D11]